MNFIKKYLVLALTLFMTVAVFGQNIPPAEWSHSVSSKNIKVGDVIELVFKSDVPKTMHIFSNKFDLEDDNCGPQRTSFTYDLTGCEIVGEATAIGVHSYVDDIWETLCGKGTISDFKDKAEFRQKIKITSLNPKILGVMKYQMCTESGMCVLFKYKFTTDNLDVSDATIVEEPKKTEPINPIPKNVEESSTSTEPKNTNETSPSDLEVKTDTPDTSSNATSSPTIENTKEPKVEVNNDDANTENDINDLSLWALFLLGVGGGLIALVTPCVFPMIPMTVAFFTKETDRKKGIKKALFYGASIVGIYLILGLILAKVFGETFTYMLSTHWLPNMIFFGIFVFFSLSFFGMFELTLPSSFVNKMDAKGDKGGYLGIFFIAFTLVLVSFSCTVPIVGSISILAAGGATLKPLIAMLGFALIFALPFVLFAIFPSWLNSLPKSGGWLNSVKVVLGFIELALALKFFSQADLVYNWGILDRDVFIAIWVVLSMLLGLYLLGKIKFPHDSDMPRVPVMRFLFAVIVFSFGLWMLPGMWGAPLKPLAGLLPPLTTQDYNVHAGGSLTSHNSNDKNIRFADVLHLPHGLTGYFTLGDAIVESKKSGKPIFVDFTGKSCANCRKMEENVWPDPSVLSRLQNDFVIASLYCDAWAIDLPEEEWSKDRDGDVLKSLGEVNSQLQLDIFKSNGQPFYYIIDTDMKIYSVFSGYKNDVPLYVEFLDKGKEGFYAKH